MKKTIMALLLVGAGGAYAAEVPGAVSLFKRSAEDLVWQRNDPMHPATVSAMRDMATALRSIRGIPDDHAQAIEAQAIAIERSQPQSHTHEDAAKRALESAISGLATLPSCGALEARLPAARASVRKIDDQRAFLKQRKVIDGAFVEVAGAIETAATCPRGVAEIPDEERQPVGGRLQAGEVKRVRLQRGVFDTVGETADIDTLCGNAGVQRVKSLRTRGDIAAGVFTAGFYTPAHVEVTCNPAP